MRRFRYCRSESGIALVITLIMLAIVTLMAVVFLALARRERASVQVVEDLATAQYMADAALERAKAQAIAQMAVAGSKLSYDLFVSTNFISPFGFQPQGNRDANPTNVSYVLENGQPVTGQDRLQVIRNLQYDARVPVYISTNENDRAPLDFRFFLDFDRNQQFEPNGVRAEIDHRGLEIENTNGEVISNRFTGDPEWVGILQNPNEAHSESNRFIGRIAYIALPAGKTLSLNNIHNQANLNAPPDTSSSRAAHGFQRHQGYGSWELNFAAFLRELNTNNYAWNSNTYFMPSPLVGGFPRGASFDDAKAFLNLRYNGSRNNLHPASALFSNGAQEFTRDGIDNYSDGPLLMNANLGFGNDNDNPDLPWPGSPTTNGFYDVQEFFTFGGYSADTAEFTNRLRQAMLIRPGKRSTYDQYTFYRLLSQMGVDSTPYLKGKLHLNYRNEIGQVSTNMVPWTNAVEFFTQAADLMLKTSIVKNIIPLNHLGQPATRGQQVVQLYTNYVIGDTPVRPDISITNIQVWHVPPFNQPYATSNEYSASIHRILQVAANIWDNMTNRWTPLDQNHRAKYPTVFRPVFTKTATNIIISDFVEVTDSRFLEQTINNWFEPSQYHASSRTEGVPQFDVNLYGQPWVIGTKKGHPNFNEFSVESDLQVTRRMELSKDTRGGPVVDTNLLFTVSLKNVWGLEGWNSYLSNYNREVQLFADVSSMVVLSNNFGASTGLVAWATNKANAAMTIDDWAGIAPGIGQYKRTNFVVPIYSTLSMLTHAGWSTNAPYFQTNYSPNTTTLFRDVHDAPKLQLYTTNRVRYWVIDETTHKVIDFVNLNNLRTKIDLGALLSSTNSPATEQWSARVTMNEQQLWDPRRVGTDPLTIGMTNQIAVSMGDPVVYANLWDNYTHEPESKNWEVDVFRTFIGEPALFIWPAGEEPRAPRLRYETPFNPSRRFYVRFSWAADDPLVHYTSTDLQPEQPVEQSLTVAAPIPVSQETGLSGNLAAVNERYKPWGGGLNDPSDTNLFNMALKDPGIWGSDAWDFPIIRAKTNYFRYPSIGWLGQVHRGSAWQTIYLKAAPSRAQNAPDPAVTWLRERGTLGNHPVKDWRLLDVFTIAPNEAAASGLLSVNQTNRAAWAAVLGGLPQTIIRNNRDIAADNPPDYGLELIEPASAELKAIVDSINQYRGSAATLKTNWVLENNSWKAQVFTNGVFESLGTIIGAPGLTTFSPYLQQATNGAANPAARIDNHIKNAWTDRIVEQIPMQIMSLLQRDEPRFVVYGFGQALQPAPRSIETSANYYGLCTNYQITGEVITKTTFRVEGNLEDPVNPLRAVVESYKVLPPPE